MIIGHLSGLSGKSDSTPSLSTQMKSSSGILTNKGKVMMDHLIEIAGDQDVKQVNQLYNKKSPPR